jgi:cobalt/nickel transport system ATP-binding protein
LTVAIDIRGLVFRFSGGPPALSDVSMRVAGGERVALLGPNGAGKSTLLLHVAGLLPEPGSAHESGDVSLFGHPSHLGYPDVVRRRIGLLFQDPDDQLFCPTIGEDVGFGPRQFGLRGRALETRIADSLARVGLAGFENRSPHQLSGGEKKRAALAGLLAYEPDVLVLDEPTSGLDPRARRQLVGILETLAATCIVATHDLALAAEVCPRSVLLSEGRVVADGPTRSLLRDDALMSRHGLETPRSDLPARLLGE